MVQGPMSRFGDTAANTGVLTLLDNIESTRDLNVGVKTIAASAAAALFRIVLMPVDTVKVGYLHVCYYHFFVCVCVYAWLTFI
jgi:hypothetical protein